MTKLFYNEVTKQDILNSNIKILSKYIKEYIHSLKLFGSAFLKAAVMQTATNGFRQTDIYPLNRNIFPEHIFAPSLTTDRPTPEPRPEENAVEVPRNPHSQHQDSTNKEVFTPAASVPNVSTPSNLTASEPEQINLPCCSKSLSPDHKLVLEANFQCFTLRIDASPIH